MADAAQPGRYRDGHTTAYRSHEQMGSGPAKLSQGDRGREPERPAQGRPAPESPAREGLPVSASPPGRWAAHIDRGLYVWGESHRGAGIMPEAPAGEVDAWSQPGPAQIARELLRKPKPEPAAEPEAG